MVPTARLTSDNHSLVRPEESCQDLELAVNRSGTATFSTSQASSDFTSLHLTSELTLSILNPEYQSSKENKTQPDKSKLISRKNAQTNHPTRKSRHRHHVLPRPPPERNRRNIQQIRDHHNGIVSETKKATKDHSLPGLLASPYLRPMANAAHREENRGAQHHVKKPSVDRSEAARKYRRIEPAPGGPSVTVK
ncbi:hypothetical protein Q7P37_002441 [Cladosporium fusiforme]